MIICNSCTMIKLIINLNKMKKKYTYLSHLLNFESVVR